MDPYDEAAAIAQKVKTLLTSDDNVKGRDIAILTRLNDSHALIRFTAFC